MTCSKGKFGRLKKSIENVLVRSKVFPSEELLPGIPDEIFEGNIWKKIRNDFNLKAETGYFTVFTLEEFMDIRAVNKRWRSLTSRTYLLGVIKFAVNDFGCYKKIKEENFPKDYIPSFFISHTIFNFYSKFPKLQCFGQMSWKVLMEFMDSYDSLNPLKKWEFTIDCFNLGYLEENPFKAVKSELLEE